MDNFIGGNVSELNINKEGMSILEVVKTYPEIVVATIKKHGIEDNKDQLERAIELAKKYIENIKGHDRQEIVHIQGLIEWLEEKLEEAIRTLDYDKAKSVVEALPKFYIGEEVMTDIGKGLLISISMPSNGLYLSPERAVGIVWYSTQDSKGGYVQKEYSLTDLDKTKKEGSNLSA